MLTYNILRDGIFLPRNSLLQSPRTLSVLEVSWTPRACVISSDPFVVPLVDGLPRLRYHTLALVDHCWRVSMSVLRGATNDVIGRLQAPGWLVAVGFC